MHMMPKHFLRNTMTIFFPPLQSSREKTSRFLPEPQSVRASPLCPTLHLITDWFLSTVLTGPGFNRWVKRINRWVKSSKVKYRAL